MNEVILFVYVPMCTTSWRHFITLMSKVSVRAKPEREPHHLTLASQRMSSLDHCSQTKIHLIIVLTLLDHCIKQWILFPFKHPLSRCKLTFFEAVMWLRHVYSVGRWCLAPPSNRCGCVMSARRQQRLAALYARCLALTFSATMSADDLIPSDRMSVQSVGFQVRHDPSSWLLHLLFFRLHLG